MDHAALTSALEQAAAQLLLAAESEPAKAAEMRRMAARLQEMALAVDPGMAEA